MSRVTLQKNKLSNLCSLVTDGTHDTPKVIDSGIPLIKAKEIKDGRIDFKNCDKISYDDHLKVISRSKPEKGDILFTHIGASIGVTAFVNTSREFSIKNVALFKPDPAKINRKYLYYSVIGPKFQDEIINCRRGVAQPFFSIDFLRNFVIDYDPSRVNQNKIAAILSAYDDLIDNNSLRIRILEEMAQAIYNEWFVNFRFPGHEGTRMVESELGLIPESWEVSTIGKISNVIPGYAFSSRDWCDEGIPVVKITNIQPRNLIDINKVDHISEATLSSKQEKYWISNGDFLIAMTGATAGKVGKLRSKERMLLNQRVAKIDAKTHYKEYLWCVISTPDAEKKFHALADGAAQPNMSGTQIENTKFILPSFTLLKQFNEFVSPMLNSIDNFVLQEQLLCQTRDLLLPKLISGGIDVSGLNIRIPEAEV